MTSRRMRWIAWSTVLLYVLIAVCLTHMPHEPREMEQFKDKTLHTIGYFMYAAVTYTAASITWPRFRGLAMIVVFALALWAAADEITQPYFGRTCDFLDWRADMIGAVSAVVLLSTLRFIAGKWDRERRLVPSPGTPGEG